MKRVLVLGSGLVIDPLLRYLLDQGLEVVVASLNYRRAARLMAGYPNGRAVAFDVEDRAGLTRLVDASDAVASLLPWSLHPKVAEVCLARRKHLVTTSYTSDTMRRLDGAAREADLLFLNECGLDPGLDHMTAMRILDRVRAQGGEVLEFLSDCGGLPAPQSNTNPFGYKVSWSPRGVALAGRNGARYLRDGEVVEIPPGKIFEDVERRTVAGLGDFEVYPNRDSLPYLDTYGLHGVRTFKRGTLRNLGWCQTWEVLVALGLLDEKPDERLAGKSPRDIVRLIAGLTQANPVAEVAARTGLSPTSDALQRLVWLGLFEDEGPKDCSSPLDLLSNLMEQKLAYGRNEQDLIILQHIFVVRYPSGARQRITSTLCETGQRRGHRAMARTVALPAAIALRLLLEGRLELRGAQIPIHPQLYGPILDELAGLGIEARETVEELS